MLTLGPLFRPEVTCHSYLLGLLTGAGFVYQRLLPLGRPTVALAVGTFRSALLRGMRIRSQSIFQSIWDSRLTWRLRDLFLEKAANLEHPVILLFGRFLSGTLAMSGDICGCHHWGGPNIEGVGAEMGLHTPWRPGWSPTKNDLALILKVHGAKVGGLGPEHRPKPVSAKSPCQCPETLGLESPGWSG